MKTPLTPLDWKRRAVSLYPTKIAVVDGDLTFTYREFDERTWRLSQALRARGHGGQHVAALLYNTHEMLECFYGVLKCANRSRHHTFSSSDETVTPDFNTTNAFGTSPHFS